YTSRGLDLRRALVDLNQGPALGLGQGAGFPNGHDIADAAFVVRVMLVQLGRAAYVLAVQRMLYLALNEHGNGFFHLVTDHTASNSTNNRVLGHDQLPPFSLRPVLTRAMSRLVCFSRCLCACCPVSFCMLCLIC